MTDSSLLCLRCMHALPYAGAPCPACGAVNGSLQNRGDQLRCGQLLEGGKYLIGQALGQGGFGVTYVAWDRNLHEKVAVKEYFPQGFVSREPDRSTVGVLSENQRSVFTGGAQRFTDEARTLLRFRTVPGIVGIREFFQENGTAYIVMDFIDGVTLKKLAAERGGKLPVEEVLFYLLPLTNALEQVHAAGLLHRDIAPDNIIVRPDGTAVLIDFGAARQISAMGEHSNTINVKHGYAPYEQYSTHGEQGPWTDIYALSATLYRLTTGVTPPQAIDRMMNTVPLAPPSSLCAGFPPALEAAVLRGLSPQGGARQQSMREFRAELTATAAPAPSPAPALYSDSYQAPDGVTASVSFHGTVVTATFADPALARAYTIWPVADAGHRACACSWDIYFTDGKQTMDVGVYCVGDVKAATDVAVKDMQSSLWVENSDSSYDWVLDAPFTVSGNVITWKFRIPERYAFDFSKLAIASVYCCIPD